MIFENSVMDLIKKRYSCRSYDGNGLHSDQLQKLTDTADALTKESLSKARFSVINKDHSTNQTPEKLGTYGMIVGARAFLMGVVDKKATDPLEFGYLFEKLILKATDMNLGTCWLGGTFNRGDFIQHAALGEEDWIPIVSPVGREKEKPRVFDHVMRAVIGADKRKPWEQLFYQADGITPLREDEAGVYGTPLEMVRLAPSASNKQPWRVMKDQDCLHFFIIRTKGYKALHYDIQKNDIGIAMCHFELSAYEMKLNGAWTAFRQDQDQMKNEYPNAEIQAVASRNGWEYLATWK